MQTKTRKLAKSEWRTYFDNASKHLALTRVTVTVSGMDVGVQTEAEKMILNGITYDPGSDALEIQAGDLRHRIHEPQAIFVQESSAGALVCCEIKDVDGREQVIELEPGLLLRASA